MARGLAPAFVRIAGPSSDKLHFSWDQDQWPRPGDSAHNVTITEPELQELVEWAKEVGGVELILCLNALERSKNTWDSRNTLDLLAYTDHKGYSLSWQLGYETSGLERAGVSGAELGADLARARALLDEFPQHKGALLLGPDLAAPLGALWALGRGSREAVHFLQDVARVAAPTPDAVVWQPWPYGAVEELDPVTDQDLVREDVNRLLGRAATRRPLWIAESGGESTSRFGDAVLWAQRIQIAARLGADAIFRRPDLLGDSRQPNPDFWVSLLHKRLCGRAVLDSRLASVPSGRCNLTVVSQCTAAPSTPAVRAVPRLTGSFASLSYERGDVTVLVVNKGGAAAKASLRLNPAPGMHQIIVHEYVLTAPNSDMNSRLTLLNGRTLALDSGGGIPSLRPRVRESSRDVTLALPPHAVAFFVFPGAHARACQCTPAPDPMDSEHSKGSQVQLGSTEGHEIQVQFHLDELPTDPSPFKSKTKEKLAKFMKEAKPTKKSAIEALEQKLLKNPEDFGPYPRASVDPFSKYSFARDEEADLNHLNRQATSARLRRAAPEKPRKYSPEDWAERFKKAQAWKKKSLVPMVLFPTSQESTEYDGVVPVAPLFRPEDTKPPKLPMKAPLRSPMKLHFKKPNLPHQLSPTHRHPPKLKPMPCDVAIEASLVDPEKGSSEEEGTASDGVDDENSFPKGAVLIEVGESEEEPNSKENYDYVSDDDADLTDEHEKPPSGQNVSNIPPEELVLDDLKGSSTDKFSFGPGEYFDMPSQSQKKAAFSDSEFGEMDLLVEPIDGNLEKQQPSLFEPHLEDYDNVHATPHPPGGEQKTKSKAQKHVETFYAGAPRVRNDKSIDNEPNPPEEMDIKILLELGRKYLQEHKMTLKGSTAYKIEQDNHMTPQSERSPNSDVDRANKEKMLTRVDHKLNEPKLRESSTNAIQTSPLNGSEEELQSNNMDPEKHIRTRRDDSSAPSSLRRILSSRNRGGPVRERPTLPVPSARPTLSPPASQRLRLRPRENTVRRPPINQSNPTRKTIEDRIAERQKERRDERRDDRIAERQKERRDRVEKLVRPQQSTRGKRSAKDDAFDSYRSMYESFGSQDPPPPLALDDDDLKRLTKSGIPLERFRYGVLPNERSKAQVDVFQDKAPKLGINYGKLGRTENAMFSTTDENMSGDASEQESDIEEEDASSHDMSSDFTSGGSGLDVKHLTASITKTPNSYDQTNYLIGSLQPDNGVANVLDDELQDTTGQLQTSFDESYGGMKHLSSYFQNDDSTVDGESQITSENYYNPSAPATDYSQYIQDNNQHTAVFKRHPINNKNIGYNYIIEYRPHEIEAAMTPDKQKAARSEFHLPTHFHHKHRASSALSHYAQTEGRRHQVRQQVSLKEEPVEKQCAGKAFRCYFDYYMSRPQSDLTHESYVNDEAMDNSNLEMRQRPSVFTHYTEISEKTPRMYQSQPKLADAESQITSESYYNPSAPAMGYSQYVQDNEPKYQQPHLHHRDIVRPIKSELSPGNVSGFKFTVPERPKASNHKQTIYEYYKTDTDGTSSPGMYISQEAQSTVNNQPEFYKEEEKSPLHANIFDYTAPSSAEEYYDEETINPGTGQTLQTRVHIAGGLKPSVVYQPKLSTEEALSGYNNKWPPSARDEYSPNTNERSSSGIRTHHEMHPKVSYQPELSIDQPSILLNVYDDEFRAPETSYRNSIGNNVEHPIPSYSEPITAEPLALTGKHYIHHEEVQQPPEHGRNLYSIPLRKRLDVVSGAYVNPVTPEDSTENIASIEPLHYQYNGVRRSPLQHSTNGEVMPHEVPVSYLYSVDSQHDYDQPETKRKQSVKLASEYKTNPEVLYSKQIQVSPPSGRRPMANLESIPFNSKENMETIPLSQYSTPLQYSNMRQNEWVESSSPLGSDWPAEHIRSKPGSVMEKGLEYSESIPQPQESGRLPQYYIQLAQPYQRPQAHTMKQSASIIGGSEDLDVQEDDSVSNEDTAYPTDKQAGFNSIQPIPRTMTVFSRPEVHVASLEPSPNSQSRDEDIEHHSFSSVDQHQRGLIPYQKERTPFRPSKQMWGSRLSSPQAQWRGGLHSRTKRSAHRGRSRDEREKEVMLQTNHIVQHLPTTEKTPSVAKVSALMDAFAADEDYRDGERKDSIKAVPQADGGSMIEEINPVKVIEHVQKALGLLLDMGFLKLNSTEPRSESATESATGAVFDLLPWSLFKGGSGGTTGNVTNSDSIQPGDEAGAAMEPPRTETAFVDWLQAGEVNRERENDIDDEEWSAETERMRKRKLARQRQAQDTGHHQGPPNAVPSFMTGIISALMGKMAQLMKLLTSLTKSNQTA